MKTHFLYLLLLLFLPLLAGAQTFKAGIVGGVNFTQIDGDNVGGYNKFGANAGFIAEIPLTGQWAVSMELLYAQKGSRAVVTANNPFEFKINMDYAEIPVLAKFHDKKGGFNFGGGLALGRLVRSKYVEGGVDATESYFNGPNKPKKWDFSIIADVSYMITPVWGISLRGGYSLIPVRQDPNSVFRRSGQFNNVLSLRTVFMFSAISKKK